MCLLFAWNFSFTIKTHQAPEISHFYLKTEWAPILDQEDWLAE